MEPEGLGNREIFIKFGIKVRVGFLNEIDGIFDQKRVWWISGEARALKHFRGRVEPEGLENREIFVQFGVEVRAGFLDENWWDFRSKKGVVN